MLKGKFFIIGLLGLLIFMGSCKAYKQDILFRLDENFTESDLSTAISHAESNYRLQPNDYLQLEVFTNDGERLIDPNFELLIQQNNQQTQNKKQYQYLIQTDGLVKLPMIGMKNLSGLTVNEAEAVLQQAYDVPYKDSFIKLSVINRRVVVLGANGGQVVNIQNENTSLIEILALYGGLNLGAKGQNIKLIRGDLTHPEVYQIDLGTISGMQGSIVDVEAGDIIYVEPWRRPWLESLKDIYPLLGLTSSVLTLIVVIQNLGN